MTITQTDREQQDFRIPADSDLYFFKRYGRAALGEPDEVIFIGFVHPAMRPARDYRRIKQYFWKRCVDLFGDEHPLIREPDPRVSLMSVLVACTNLHRNRHFGVVQFSMLIAGAIQDCPEAERNIYR